MAFPKTDTFPDTQAFLVRVFEADPKGNHLNPRKKGVAELAATL
jgi:hypothetical protein